MKTMKDIDEMREFLKKSQEVMEEEAITIPESDTLGFDFSGPEDDPVNQPSHYKSDSIEVIEVIDEFVPDPYSYYMGNVVKYVLRHGKKNNAKQDLEKARWYLNKMIEDWND